MKRVPLGVIICVLSWFSYLALSSVLAGQDVIAALSKRELGALLLVALVLGLRLFLILAAPGWLLWLVVERLERFSGSSSSRPRPDT